MTPPFLSLFLISGCVILWEILLTRIFSVVLYYHYAFLAVSVAMFGLTLGALLVFLRAPVPQEKLQRRLGRLALWTGLLIAIAITVQLSLPLRFVNRSAPAGYLLATYLLSSLPFVPAGAFFCLALTRFERPGALYAADLIGAGLGCAVAPLLLPLLGGPGAVIATAAAACVAGWILLRTADPRWARLGAASALLLVAFAVANREGGWLKVRWMHSGPARAALHERWNAFSRITVSPFPNQAPFGWGIDPEFLARAKPVEQLYLEIDSGAGTPMTRFGGGLEGLEHLRHDLTGLAHRLRPQADALVIGSGGGRDVLTALAYRQRSVRAVEVNPEIVAALNGTFGDFTGHLDRRPDVAFAVDEGRSYLARTKDRFDILQVSFIDTVAATAAGAYAFVENGLYTVEGWKLFLSRLKPNGVLTFSRFYYGSSSLFPVEIYRTVALASAALRASGAAEARRHILLARTRNVAVGEGVATILVSPDPFSEADRENARRACEELHCEIALSPWEEKDPELARIAAHVLPEELAGFPLDITPPFDDRPFFFFHVRAGDLLRGKDFKAYGGSAFNLPAVRILLALTATSLLLGAGLALLPPLWLGLAGRWPKVPYRGAGLMPAYFALIGAAFMFLEIGWIQRLGLFLGHPVYGFTVVLFGLLASTGLGSLISEKIAWAKSRFALAPLLPILLASELLAAVLLQQAAGAPTPARIALSLLLISPPAVMMGFAMPLGLGLARRMRDERVAWYWAINGAASVVASVLAMLASLSFGIGATVRIGAVLYAATAAILIKITPEPS